MTQYIIDRAQIVMPESRHYTQRYDEISQLFPELVTILTFGGWDFVESTLTIPGISRSRTNVRAMVVHAKQQNLGMLEYLGCTDDELKNWYRIPENYIRLFNTCLQCLLNPEDPYPPRPDELGYLDES